MAGDGGRVPDVSEQRTVQRTVIEALEAMRSWTYQPPVTPLTMKKREQIVVALDAVRAPDPASVLAALLAESPDATVAAIEALGFDRARDGTVAVEDVQSLVNALRRIAYGLEGEMGRYDTPRDDTWWGRIALEALAQFGSARAGVSDEGGNQ